MSAEREKLIADLKATGFFNMTEGHRVEEIRALFVSGDEPDTEYPCIYDDSTNRVCRIDAESVAEGWGADELRRFTELLHRFGIELTVEELHDDDGDYVVGVNGIRYLVLSAEEMAEERDWLLATRRVLAVVNRLLIKVGTDERAYLLYMGELSLALFLTPQIFNVLSKSEELHFLEKPQAIDVRAVEA